MTGPLRVKEKPVAQIELFGDLIYVYAISRMTALVEEPVAGVVPAAALVRYLVLSLVVLQAWLYMTNYVNRYGTWRWFEYALAGVNMVATVYVSNTISPDWEAMSGAFNVGMLVMLLCVAALYAIQVMLKRQDLGAAKNSLTILGVVCAVYLAAIALGALGATSVVVIWLDVAAVVVGAFLPFFVRGHFDPSIISWPHLVERFELLVLVTFGEGIVGMTGFFDTTRLSVVPLMVFGVLIFLFGCYVVQVHNLVEHHARHRALRLMFSHYVIVIAINLLTVALKGVGEAFAPWALEAMMVAALVLYFVALMAHGAYYKEGVARTGQDAVALAAVVALGCLIVLLSGGEVHRYLAGALVAAVGGFVLLYRRQRALEAGADSQRSPL